MKTSDREQGEAGTESYILAAWKPPLIIAAIVLSMVVGSYLGGPGLGMAIGAIAASSIIVMAARKPPKDPMVAAPSDDDRNHVLLVVGEPLESPEAIEQVVEATERAGGTLSGTEFLVLAPRRQRFLDRWTSDTERGRAEAQRCLVFTLASLAKAGIAATARVGDEDPVQAVDDQLSSYPATQVIFVDRAAAAAQELRSRLRVPFLHLTAGTSAPSSRAGTLLGSSG
jgi:hypothetical protein